MSVSALLFEDPPQKESSDISHRTSDRDRRTGRPGDLSPSVYSVTVFVVAALAVTLVPGRLGVEEPVEVEESDRDHIQTIL